MAAEPGREPRIAARGPKLTLDLDELGRLGEITWPASDARKRNEFRLIRRQLLSSLAELPPRGRNEGAVVAVTSATSGEGKTFTSFNIARAIAEHSGNAVILVDADLARGTLSHTLGAENRPGVADFLRGTQVELDALVSPTSEPRLAFLSSGVHTDGAHHLLAGNRTHQLIHRLRAIADGAVVILDCSPVLLTEDAGHIAGSVDRVIFVVRAGVTLGDAVAEGVDRLGAREKTLLVLNGWEPVRPSERDFNSQHYNYYESQARKNR
ncbi:MAG TPA: AAA family ATPase [Steroidobacteraceae bacterium]|nr:AAA family ATPase [Steroidobacteraceae bacterium]